MPRQLDRLSAKFVAGKRKPGYYCDGAGLYLQVSDGGTKSWVFRYKLNGKTRDMGLGALHTVGLAEARTRAAAARLLVHDGVDPIVARDERKRSLAAASLRSKTFAECAVAYIKAHRSEWRNAKHAGQWTNTIETYANPVIGPLDVADVDTSLVLKVLEPIWETKLETATRLRGRIELILGWAAHMGYRNGDNPARWRGHLEHSLAKPGKLKKQEDHPAKVEHHAALPFDQIGEFVQSLHSQEGIAARALEFAILTAARTGEVIGAAWQEINFEDKVWTVPASRMKAQKEHRIPLPAQALAVLEKMREIRTGEYVFPGRVADRPLSNMAMLELLKRMGRGNLTVHGFRSTFRDWAAERTSYPREVAEMALAHKIPDKVEAAYRRGDLFEKRRRLMAEWAKHCASGKRVGKVVSLNTGAKALPA